MSTLPPLHSLLVFETLVRTGGIQPAADELCVTPGAVSKQVRKLEEWLERPILRRNGRRLELLPEAEDFLKDIREALQQIEHTSRSYKHAGEAKLLRVSAPPTFLTRWLIPRLGRFQHAFPDIRIKLENRRDRVNALPQNIDIAVRRGQPAWPDFASHKFMHEALTPLCSSVLGSSQERWALSDLQRFPCLRASMRPTDWDEWLVENQLHPKDCSSVLEFDHTFLALDAALDGLGFAMAPVYLVADEIRDGIFFAPFPRRIVPTDGHFVVYERDNVSAAAIHFHDWLMEEGKIHDRNVSEILGL